MTDTLGARTRLSAGLPTINKVLVFVLVGLVVVSVPFIALVASALGRTSEPIATIGPVVMLLVGLVAVVGAVWGIAAVVRTGAYLEGTELVVQHAFRARRVDLASARQLVLSDARTAAGTMPVFAAHEDNQGRSATVMFRELSTGLLPHHEVVALIAAIRAGQRSGQSAQLAETVVATLGSRTAA